MRKKILLGLGAAGTALALLPLFAAFEAHVINVTAQIENALDVQTQALEFGTVFPEELLFKDFVVSLSQSFLGQDRLDDVEYHIKQKDKPREPGGRVCEDYPTPCSGDPISTTEFCHTRRPSEFGDPGDPANPYYSICYPNLCPYLSKDSDDDEPQGTDNDGSIGAFHRAECDDGVDNDGDQAVDWPADQQCTSKYDDSESERGQQGLVNGILAQSLQDLRDLWTIDLHVPCFVGQCAQDNVIPVDYQLDPRLNSQVFGCDLWVEVENYSTLRPQCSDGINNDPQEDNDIDANDEGCLDPQGIYDPNDNSELLGS